MSAEEARSSCNTCKGLDYAEWLAPRWPDELRDGPRRRVMRFPELRSSAAAGCECCSVIARGAEWAWGERPEVVGDESRYTAEDERLFQLEPVNVLCVEIKPNRRLIAWRLRPPLPFDPPRDRDSPDDVDAIEFFTPHGEKTMTFFNVPPAPASSRVADRRYRSPSAPLRIRICTRGAEISLPREGCLRDPAVATQL